MIGLLDQYRFRRTVIAAPARAGAIALSATDAWKGRFFQGAKRPQFNFLFGSLSPGV